MTKPSRSGGVSFLPKSLELILQGIVDGERQLTAARELNVPLTDIYETADSLMIEIELPGCGLADVRVYITGRELSIEADKIHLRGQPENKPQKVSFLRLERKFGKFVRRIELPAPCNAQEAAARMRNGLLIIQIPLIKERRGLRIQIPVEAE